MRTTSLGLAHSEGNSWRRASGSTLGRVKVESFINSTFLVHGPVRVTIQAKAKRAYCALSLTRR